MAFPSVYAILDQEVGKEGKNDELLISLCLVSLIHSRVLTEGAPWAGPSRRRLSSENGDPCPQGANKKSKWQGCKTRNEQGAAQIVIYVALEKNTSHKLGLSYGIGFLVINAFQQHMGVSLVSSWLP